MKKMIFIVLIILQMFFVTSCETQDVAKYSVWDEKVLGDFSLEDYNECDIAFAIDEELAFEIGDAAMKSRVNDSKMEEYYKWEAIVIEITSQNLFVVSRIPNDGSEGGDINVAISKEDGRILKMWIGE